METTIPAILKQGGLPAVVLVALLIFWADFNGKFQALDEGLDELRAEMVKGDQATRVEVNAGFQAILAEMAESDQAIRAEIAESNQSIRAEMNAGFQAIRAEMAESDQAIRAEMAESDQAIRADISALGERMARVETRLDSIEDRLYMDTSLAPADL